MNKLIVFIFFFINSYNIYAQLKLRDLPEYSQTINQRNKKGKQGIWVSYTSNDSIVDSVMQYKNNLLHGKCTVYNTRTGKVLSTSFYKAGEKDGLLCSYYWNGNLMTKANFKDGQQHGLSYYYGEDGKMIIRENYVYNMPDNSYDSLYIDRTYKFVEPIEFYDTIQDKNYPYLKKSNEKRSLYKDKKYLVREIYSSYGKTIREDYFNYDAFYKRVIYRKDGKRIKKIFYYQPDERLFRTEFYDKKNRVIKNINN